MKTIKSIDDLAINGATPAFSEPLHVGKPNLGSEKDFINYVRGIFARKWVTNNGPLIRELESQLSKYVGTKHCVAMCNGTVALEIAIRALGLRDEVIVPSFTFIATAHALSWQEITPVFADIDPATHNIDPRSVRKLITPRTTGIIGVHLWGRACPVEELQSIANEHNLKLLFDASHAFGCSHDQQRIGTFGECEIFSFHATKFFNTFEGGAVFTNNDELAKTMRLMRNFGFVGKDNVIHPGTNGKMSEISAAMGLVNLEAINTVVSTNRQNYYAYQAALEDIPEINFLRYDERESNNYQYIVITLGDKSPITRDELLNTLQAENILARRYFWPGCHNMSPYRELYPHAGLLLPNTRDIADRIVVLPTGINVAPSMIKTVVSVIRSALKLE